MSGDNMSLDEELAKLLAEESEEKEHEDKPDKEKSDEIEEVSLEELVVEESKPSKEESAKKQPAGEPELELPPVQESSSSVSEEEPEEKEESSEIIEAGGLVLPKEVREAIDKIPVPVEEEPSPAKYVILIYGEKGTGKTTTAMSFPGEIVVLSFDRKAAIIKSNIYNNDKRIHVFDVVKYMDYSTDETMLKTAELTYLYALKILDYSAKKIKPDWIIIDGAEIFQQIAEWVMRYRHGLKPFEGIRNLNLWKYRKQLIRDLHTKALNIARRGIIYTTNVEYEEIIVEGELVARKDVPKWIDILVYETDIVLKTVRDPRTREFKVEVVTSKDDKLLPTGKVYVVTDKPLGTQIKFPK